MFYGVCGTPLGLTRSILLGMESTTTSSPPKGDNKKRAEMEVLNPETKEPQTVALPEDNLGDQEVSRENRTPLLKVDLMAPILD